MNKYYTQGFIKACQDHGVDPDQLVKAAVTLSPIDWTPERGKRYREEEVRRDIMLQRLAREIDSIKGITPERAEWLHRNLTIRPLPPFPIVPRGPTYYPLFSQRPLLKDRARLIYPRLQRPFRSLSPLGGKLLEAAMNRRQNDSMMQEQESQPRPPPYTPPEWHDYVQPPPKDIIPPPALPPRTPKAAPPPKARMPQPPDKLPPRPPQAKPSPLHPPTKQAQYPKSKPGSEFTHFAKPLPMPYKPKGDTWQSIAIQQNRAKKDKAGSKMVRSMPPLPVPFKYVDETHQQALAGDRAWQEQFHRMRGDRTKPGSTFTNFGKPLPMPNKPEGMTYRQLLASKRKPKQQAPGVGYQKILAQRQQQKEQQK